MSDGTFIERKSQSLPLSFPRTLLLGAKAAGDLKLKPVFTDLSKNSRAFRNYVKSAFYKWNNKAWMKVHLLKTCFTEYFMPTAESYYSEKKKKISKYHCSLASGHSRTLMEMYNEIHVDFMPTNTTFYSPLHSIL